ncbi:MAG: FtsH protease activity modulator HflK [Robiginitomaculum sp.]|nr:MAG: FtsH protease activity modulator HflK [Robiginitomaculum sp.]
MASNNQQNGNGDGPWGQKPGGGGKGPWGSGPGGGEDLPNIDVDEMIRNLTGKFGGVFGGGGGRGKGGGQLGGFGIGVFLILGAFLWIAMPGSGWYVAEADEEGVVLRFGAYTRTEPPGFHFKLPVPFERVLKPKVTAAHQIDVGFSKSNGSERGIPGESLMLTGDENIVELGFSVFWQIKEAQAYLFNIESPDIALKAVAESAMREIVGKNTLQDIITARRGQIEEEARDNIQVIMDGYGAGIVVTQVQIARSQAPGQVNDAFRDVVNAAQDKETTINVATAYRNDKVPKARGGAQQLIQEAEAYREARVAEAKGEAARFTLVYQEYKLAPQVTRQRMYLETMERVLENSEKILLDPESAGGVVPYLPLGELNKGKGQ